MKSDYDKIIHNNLIKTVDIYYDKLSDGIKVSDPNGVSLNIEEVEQLIKGLNKYITTHDKALVNSKKDKELQASIMTRTSLKKYKPKNGTVFVFKELTTNRYKFVSTKDFTLRFRNLENEYPNGIELITKHKASDVILLKSLLEEKFEKRRLYNNWYNLDKNSIKFIKQKQLSDIYGKKVQEKENEILQTIICDSCLKQVTNLEEDFYYQCLVCRKKYCSHKCAVEEPHSC